MAKSTVNYKAQQYNKNVESSINDLPIDRITIEVNNQRRVIDCSLLRVSSVETHGDIIEERKSFIDTYVRNLHKHIKDGGSQTSLERYYMGFKRYLRHCDENLVNPMNKEGYLSYHNYLWERVRNSDVFKPLWLYENNEELPFTEASAKGEIGFVKKSLLLCNVFSDSWSAQLPMFQPNNNPIESYSENEIKLLLSRLLSFFAQITTSIIRTNDPFSPIDISIDGTLITVGKPECRGKHFSNSSHLGFPINQAMIAGFFLMSYFTAMNSTPLLSICRPLIRISSKKIDRTEEWFEFEAYKRRGNHDVYALVGGDVSERITGKALKSGYQFIILLETLSNMFHSHSNGSLLYLLDKDENPIPISPTRDAYCLKLEVLLHLVSDNNLRAIEPLINTFYNLVNNQKYDHIKTHKKGNYVKRTVKKARHWRAMAGGISFAILNCIIDGDIDIRKVTLPLTIKEESDCYIVSGTLLSGELSSFEIKKEYKNIFDDIVFFTMERYKHCQKKKCPHKMLTPELKSGILVPIEGLVPNGMGFNKLSDYGIRNGDYFLELQNAKFRKANAMLARVKTNSSLISVQQILHNSINVQLAHYCEDNPERDKQIVHQALLVIERLAKGEELELAKKNVAKYLEMDVLTYESINKFRGYTTIAGTFCSYGSTPSHNQQSYRVKKMQLLDKNYQLHCSQYDECIGCSSCKMVDEVDAVYKLLSFIECLKDAEHLYRSQFEVNLGEVIQKINLAINVNLSKRTVLKARELLRLNGRHIYWTSTLSLTIGSSGGRN